MGSRKYKDEKAIEPLKRAYARAAFEGKNSYVRKTAKEALEKIKAKKN